MYIPKDNYKLYFSEVNNVFQKSLYTNFAFSSGIPTDSSKVFPKGKPPLKLRITDLPNIILPQKNIIVIPGTDPLVAPNVPISKP